MNELVSLPECAQYVIMQDEIERICKREGGIDGRNKGRNEACFDEMAGHYWRYIINDENFETRISWLETDLEKKISDLYNEMKQLTSHEKFNTNGQNFCEIFRLASSRDHVYRFYMKGFFESFKDSYIDTTSYFYKRINEK